MNLRSNQPAEYKVDPNTSTVSLWVKANGVVGSPGLAMGVMGLTYSQTEINNCDLKFKTVEGKTVSTVMQ